MSDAKKFEKITSDATYISVKNIPKDDPFQGKFLETYEGKFGLNHKFEATSDLVTTNNKDEKVAINEGDLVIINGSGMLNSKLSRVAAGSEVLIEYLGEEAIKNGNFKGKNAHIVDISVAVD